ncbi:MAG: ASCH domain-containing protein [Candidatus Woesearchaeota archaeon]
MKVLSLKQPYAELILSGKKTIEIRSWNTKFRGWFLIHASKTPDKNAMKSHGYEQLPVGVIVGKAELVGVKEYADQNEFEKDAGKHLATIDYGRFGFLLDNPKRLPPVEAKGKLGFWEFEYQK